MAAAPARAQTAAPDQRTITVTGTGLVDAPNDAATLGLTVRTKHGTAARALADTSARTRRVLAALAAQGIAREDIQTQTVGVSRSLGPKRKHGKRKVFYSASTSLSVIVRQVSKAGGVIAAAVKAGVTRVEGIEFFPSNESGVYRQALGLAYDDARAKAALLADRADVTLGRPLSIVEGQDNFEPAPGDLQSFSNSVAILPGTATISALVTVVFAIE